MTNRPVFDVEFVPGGFLPPADRAPYRAANHLRKLGHHVEEQDIPGLWRINGGPEITSGQLLSIAAANAVRPAP